MLEKICKNCNNTFSLPRAGKKEQARLFCGPICSRRWTANNRSETWKQKASLAKQGEKNPMFGVSQNNPNSLANLTRSAWTGKHQSVESNEKRSNSMKGKSSWTEESKKKYIQTGIEQGRFWKPDDPEHVEFKKYRRKVYYWTSKNNLNVLENSDKRGRGRYHLDHKYSITKGFLDNIPPKILGCIHNLEMLTHKKNIVKNSKCSISKEKLLDLYYDGENKI